MITRLDAKIERNAFDDAVIDATGDELRSAERISTIQVNIGLTCNLACHHCHVESSPKRGEQMTRETMEHVLRAAELCSAHTIDITGGAPEMNPHFRWFVAESRLRGYQVIVRTNLTILLSEGYRDLPGLFKAHRAHLVASLPCYLETNVDKQRGKHVYSESIDVIRVLNAVGYGVEESLPLDLVYNPLGPTLPPEQVALERDYRRELKSRYGVVFTRLITIANMPIGRFAHDLAREGRAEAYQQLLHERFNAATVDPLMCRHQMHISYDGSLHDCDFNYALSMRCNGEGSMNIKNFDPQRFLQRRIATGEHCFGCTAGSGSSCGGALVK